MIYEIEYTPDAESDIEKFKKSGNKAILIKIDNLLNELRNHPTSGTGKPEKLKHYVITTWSRRITDKNRLIYRIQDDKIIVLVLSLFGHYDDK
jgi:toxin YoeB